MDPGHEIVVPASISNLGPAFDTLAVAVQLYLRVRVVDVRPDAPDQLDTVFVDCPLAGENRIESAFRRARAEIGRAAPGLRIEVRSDIPQRAGLGSSAAAAVAGLQLYGAVTEPRAPADWLQLASHIEGHPDNAAAALFGGITASCQRDDGRVTAVAWRWPEAVRFVIATPHVPVDTGYARSLLPTSIGLRDAVFNLQHALLLVRTLETGCYSQLREALRDRWHQPFRAPLVPGLAEALVLEHPALLGVCLSGSGPSIVALTSDPDSGVPALLHDLYDRLDIPCTIRSLAAHQPPPA